MNPNNKVLTEEQIKQALTTLTNPWEVVANKEIRYDFKFPSFTSSMAFVNQVAALCEAEHHHPDIGIFLDRVQIILSTHEVSGLSEKDFVMAAKIENLYGNTN